MAKSGEKNSPPAKPGPDPAHHQQLATLILANCAPLIIEQSRVLGKVDESQLTAKTQEVAGYALQIAKVGSAVIRAEPAAKTETTETV